MIGKREIDSVTRTWEEDGECPRPHPDFVHAMKRVDENETVEFLALNPGTRVREAARQRASN